MDVERQEAAFAAASKIKLLLMDCDGVLTDGRLYFSEAGEDLKVFHVRDGQGIVNWHKAGLVSGIISGRDAGPIIEKRADELGIRYVRVGSLNKVADLEQIAADAGVSLDEVAFIGDDVGDIEVMRRVGLSVAVRDAMPDVKGEAAYVTKKKGGRGAVREVIELIFRSKSEAERAGQSRL